MPLILLQGLVHQPRPALLMAMAQGPDHAIAHVTPAKFPLTKASHVAEPKVKG